MPLRPLLPAILLSLFMSIIVAVLAAGRASDMILGVAVGLFAAQMVFATVRTNTPFWQNAHIPPEEGGAAVVCAWRNTVLAALIYTWGASAMLAIYSLSGLIWRHWWQYGAAMALVATALFLYSNLLSNGPASYRKPAALKTLMSLTAAQGVAVTAAIIYLIISGKMLTPRSDWAANYIFMAGSIMLALLSIVSVMTYRAITARKPQA
jgi:hypothetical protein